MVRVSTLRSGAFRFAVLIALVFATGSAALLAIVDRAVSRYAGEVATDTVAAELEVLADEDRSSGRAQAIRSIIRRERATREHDLRYLLLDRGGRPLAGSLPPAAVAPGWHRITIRGGERDTTGQLTMTSVATLGARLPDGALLVVGSDVSDLDQLRHRLRLWSVLFGSGVTFLALAGGFAVGTIFLRRLGAVNSSVERIMTGRFAERLPMIGMSPEFDQLSSNLNRMLGQIETLLDGMRQVSTDIAHDLRTPLTRLRQRLETLKGGSSGETAVQVDAAIAQSDEILNVFKTLLRISSLEARTGRNRIGEADLSGCLRQLVEAYRPVAEDAAHTLLDDIEPGVNGRADPEMLVQAVTNLIENAIVHTPRGSSITVTLARRPTGILVAVADDGPGIPATERDRVLRRFYRLDSSRGTVGAGLGLALVAAVASLHGAALHLVDNDPGLRIELLLPTIGSTDSDA